ncbi:YqhV family protein [Paenibacillaceae bacterium WGS1546]|uniref:YqhV family protein n=1 Tax=Cohnella sp. WGS1546 TaxID=3366810 RepID=UPI00372D2E18
MNVDKSAFGMAMLRLLSGSIELTAAIVMLRLNDVQKALAVNSMLALVGPLVLISTTAIGLVGLADKLSPAKFVWIVAGVGCLLIGILRK